MTGLETVALTTISGIAVPIFQDIWTRGSKAVKEVSKSFDETAKNFLHKAFGKYAQKYKERHGKLKVVCVRMDEAVSLESVYTTVQFLDRAGISYFESPETLQELFRQTGKRRFQSKDNQKREGITVANEEQHLMVLGAPGVGKSTFLRKIGLEALKGKSGKFQHSCIPVFLNLNLFKADEIDIEKLIAQEFSICGFPASEEFTTAALKNGKLLILLDGLDEVPTDKVDLAITQIQNLVDSYDKNRFIASCRVAAYKGGFQRFKDVIIAEFDDSQIEEFINNWFRSEVDKTVETATQCWELLQNPEYAAAKELAQTPLLLTLLCLVYNDSLDFPKNRAALYGEALDVLLKKWAAEKRIQREPIYRKLSPELEQDLLAEIAYTSFEADRLFFSQREVVSQIKNFLMDNVNAPKHLDGEAVLRAIEVQQGILVERARDAYSFSHLTLQEYLTAQYIDDHRQVEKLVTEHLSDKRWKEVFLLVAGLMRGGADELLLLMEKEAQKYINTPTLKALLIWAEQITDGSQGSFKPVAKRATAITIAIAIANATGSAYAYAYAFAIAITNTYAYAYAYAIDITNDLANTITIDFANAIANANTIDFANAINLANAITNAIGLNTISHVHQLEKLKIFNNVDFAGLIARLEALKARITLNKQPLEGHQRFEGRFQKIWLQAFNIGPELVNLSEEEVKDLENYLYANYLMVQCKQAARRVSPKTWEEIEARMLRVPNK
jgi:hypothetical protein